MILRIEEALARANAQRGEKIKKGDIAAILWPDKDILTARMNFSNLLAGKTKRIEPEAIVTLCRALDCSADYLLGLSNV